MEKNGRNSHGNARAGLLKSGAWRIRAFLLACFLLFCAFAPFAAETEMMLSGPPFVAGEAFAVSFAFYGASPDAVFWEGEGDTASGYGYMEEAFPPSFSLEAVRKSSAAMPQQGVFASSGSRAAVIAIEIIPKEAGEFDIGPFLFRAGSERVTFAPVHISVAAPASQAGGQSSGELRLFWLVQERQGGGLVPPSEAFSLEAGQGALIVLMSPSHAEGSVSCPAPENALLESASVNPLEIDSLLPFGLPSGYSPAAAYIWTPLFHGRQSLPQAAFSPAGGGAASFSEEAEAVIAAPQIEQSLPPEQGLPAATALPPEPPAPLLEKPAAFSPRAADSRFEASLANAASSLWDEGQQARAAVILRSAENAFPFRKRIAEMRSAADEALDVEGKSVGALERLLFFAPFVLILLVLILFAALFISWAAPSKKGGKSDPSFGGKKLIISCAVLAALAAGGALCASLSGGMEEAAASGGFLRRVPDGEAAAVALVKPGAPLKIESRTASWLYVKTLSGEAGWYPSSEIIVYKSGDLHEFR